MVFLKINNRFINENDITYIDKINENKYLIFSNKYLKMKSNDYDLYNNHLILTSSIYTNKIFYDKNIKNNFKIIFSNNSYNIYIKDYELYKHIRENLCETEKINNEYINIFPIEEYIYRDYEFKHLNIFFVNKEEDIKRLKKIIE